MKTRFKGDFLCAAMAPPERGFSLFSVWEVCVEEQGNCRYIKIYVYIYIYIDIYPRAHGPLLIIPQSNTMLAI